MKDCLDHLDRQTSTRIAGVTGWFCAFLVPVSCVPTALLTPTVSASFGRGMT